MSELTKLPFLSRVEDLDLSKVELSAEGLRRFLELAPHLKHLRFKRDEWPDRTVSFDATTFPEVERGAMEALREAGIRIYLNGQEARF